MEQTFGSFLREKRMARGLTLRGMAAKLRFRPENGMKVIAFGRITVFPRDGAYQLYCTRLIPGGVGDLYAAYEQLKEQLQKEGLFDRVFTTNLIYQSPELLSRPYYISCDMSKYIAYIIDTLNHDSSISDLLNPYDRIQRLVAKYKAEQN